LCEDLCHRHLLVLTEHPAMLLGARCSTQLLFRTGSLTFA
jgi:hypothetical protein